MLLTLILFLQAHPPQKVSWLLWTVGGFFFLAGLGLLIFLIRKRRQLGVEDEFAVKKLFADEPAHKPAAVEPLTYQTQPLSDKEPEISEVEEAPDRLSSLEKNFPDNAEAVEEPSSEATADETKAEVISPAESPEKPVEQMEKVFSNRPVEEKTEERIYRPPATAERVFRSASEKVKAKEDVVFSLSNSPQIKEEVPLAVASSEEEPEPIEPRIDEEVADEAPVVEHQTSTLASSPESFSALPHPAANENVTTPLSSALEDASSARIEHPASRQNFELPLTKPSREPFEPPRIEPLVAQSQQPEPTPFTTSRQTKISTPLPSRETRLDREPLAPFESELPQTKPAPLTASQPEMVRAVTAEPAWRAPQAGRKVAGAVLGLPVETSDAPLVIGKPVISEDEIGVTGFRDYGKSPDASDTGRGGLITLLVVLLLIGGGVAAYFKVPAFHARVDAILARLRTGSSAPETVVEKPKAQVIPSRNPEVNKNIVKARGAVLNISEDTLEELAVEVSFYRGEKVIETRTVAVTPNTLAPNQQGTYEFEYDGSKSNGFALYSVTKLFSKSGELKFTSAKQ